MTRQAESAKADGPHFLCIGAAHWDVIARTDRRLRRGEDVPGRVRRQPGGVAGNVARALARLGAAPALIAAVGRDDAGDALLADLAAAGVDCRGVWRRDGPTDAYVAIEDAGGLYAAVADCTALECAGTALLAALRDGRHAARDAPWRGTSVLDGNLPAPVLAELLHGPALGGPLTIVAASPAKAAPLRSLLGGRPVTLHLNRDEAEAVCGTAFSDSGAAAAALVRLPGVAAVVTDGAGPVAATVAGGVVTRSPAAAVSGSVTGAGDAFVAAHLVARAQGCDVGAALEAAIAAAVAHVTREEA